MYMLPDFLNFHLILAAKGKFLGVKIQTLVFLMNGAKRVNVSFALAVK